ncbi:MAG TPA: DUF2071 domain-containing protein, partial [Thermoanaerobaculia bacterium]|nr:DUF2071 domain-containing protein [Thermoanaerobaculia bacterium]
DASSSIAVEAARAMYHLPYFHASIEFGEGAFTSHRDDPRGAMPAHAHIRYRPVEGPVTASAPGSIEHFLVERYILYAEHDHRLYRAQVHHQPYPVQRAELLELDETLIWAAGIRREDSLPLRHYAREVNVKVYPIERLDP